MPRFDGEGAGKIAPDLDRGSVWWGGGVGTGQLQRVLKRSLGAGAFNLTDRLMQPHERRGG